MKMERVETGPKHILRGISILPTTASGFQGASAVLECMHYLELLVHCICYNNPA